jgi:hypothetical protein
MVIFLVSILHSLRNFIKKIDQCESMDGSIFWWQIPVEQYKAGWHNITKLVQVEGLKMMNIIF